MTNETAPTTPEPKLAKRLDNFGEYIFAKLAKRVAEVEKELGRRVLNFGPGNPDYPPAPEHLIKYQEAIAEKEAASYPGYGATKEFAEALSGWYSRRFKVDLESGEYYPLLGGKDGLGATSLALLDAGDEVLVPDPGYPGFVGPALMIGAEPVNYDLLPEHDFKIDLDQLAEKISPKTKAIWVNFPSNPTGQVATLEELAPLVAFAKQHGIWLLYDNAYAEITYDDVIAPSILQVPGAKDIAIEIGSFSKMCSFAGFRMGWVTGNKELVEAIAKVKSQLDSGMSRPLQSLGSYALNNYGEEWHGQMIASYEARRNIIAEKLRGLGLTFDLPKGALYIWARIPEDKKDTESFCERLLEEKQISLVPGTAYGHNGERYVRASCCINIDNINDYF
ncbi:MAG: pyridoxal phosphate-dependent aminotransferase [Candidatus Paceibacterota bacterium]|jgi:aspartate/methionine/tyrosine aminotransferase